MKSPSVTGTTLDFLLAFPTSLPHTKRRTSCDDFTGAFPPGVESSKGSAWNRQPGFTVEGTLRGN